MLVVSIAVISSRVENITKILSNLEQQTHRPDKVLLYYSEDPWHHDQGIHHLIIPKTNLDVEAIEVPNYGSCRKYLFSAIRYRNTDASILLMDDDIMFDHCLIENLLDHQNVNQRVVGTRGWSDFQIIEDDKGKKIFQRPNSTNTIVGNKIIKPTEVAVTSSGWATMFYAKDIDQRMFDLNLHKSIQLYYSDEIFLSAMLPVGKFVIPMPDGFRYKLPSTNALNRAIETLYAKALQAELLTKIYN